MNLNGIRSRVEKIHTQRAATQKRTARIRQCIGVTWEELIQLFVKSVPLDSWPIVDDICAHIEEYQHRPPQELPDGKGGTYRSRHVHGLVVELTSRT